MELSHWAVLHKTVFPASWPIVVAMLGYDGGGSVGVIAKDAVTVVYAEGFGPPALLLDFPVTERRKLAGGEPAAGM